MPIRCAGSRLKISLDYKGEGEVLQGTKKERVLKTINTGEMRKIRVMQAQLEVLGFHMVGPTREGTRLVCTVYRPNDASYRRLEILTEDSTVRVLPDDSRRWGYDELVSGTSEQIVSRIWQESGQVEARN